MSLHFLKQTERFQNLCATIKGKKTGIVTAVVLIGALIILLTGLTFADIPAWIWTALAGVGFATIRDRINTISANDNKGFKTYLAAGAFGILSLLNILGVNVPPELLAAIKAGLASLGVVGLGSALNKVQ